MSKEERAASASRIPLRALIIEDNPDDALLLKNAIKRSGFQPECQVVDDKAELFAALGEEWDMVFSDYTMPTFDGREALKLVRLHDPDVPFFFVSGTMGEATAVEAMRLGAQDYFVKGAFERLAPAITRELRDRATRRQHRETQERIDYLANYDTLTGLPNRTLLVNQLFTLTQSQRAADRGFAVFNLNLDRFREINDHFGVNASNEVLVEVGRRLQNIKKPDDLVARLAADEFVLVVLDLAHDAEVAAAARRIFNIFDAPFKIARYEHSISASLGSSLFGPDGNDPEQLLSNAAMALHHAQRSTGRAFLAYAVGMRTALEEKLLLDRALEQALKRNEFHLHYQPQVCLRSGQIIGLEALLRWDKPGTGPVSPMSFIPVAEESGLIVPIGNWVLREVCRQLHEWREQGLRPMRVAVNFSAHQFRDRDMPDVIRGLLKEFELPPESLEIEITETALMQDAQAARAVMSALRDLGVTVALDDFGTGYSSLSYLKRFPVDTLKIDRSFIEDLPQDSDDCAIINAIIAMSDKLGLHVVAEGVETKDQLDFLSRAGCSTVQGYYLQRPASPEALGSVLSRENLF